MWVYVAGLTGPQQVKPTGLRTCKHCLSQEEGERQVLAWNQQRGNDVFFLYKKNTFIIENQKK